MNVQVRFNQRYFDQIMRSSGVNSICREEAEKVLAVAKHTAPVATGAYKSGLRIVRAERKYRTAWLVEGTDPKTLLIEAKTGNLARALKSVTGGI